MSVARNATQRLIFLIDYGEIILILESKNTENYESEKYRYLK